MNDVLMGLEIHIQLATESKMWSRVKNQYSSSPNQNVDAYTAAVPGVLPVLNPKAHELGVLACLLLNAQINTISYFDRKSYFYPDLPKSYQITQQELPLASEGNYRGIKINQVHLEEDSARSLYGQKNRLGLDLNRAGVPLLEIVTAPEFTTTGEVIGFLKQLHEDLVALKITNGIMAHGNMRVDLNISKSNAPRVEIKNLNSFKNMQRAIELELERQTQVIASEGKVVTETYGYDELADQLRLMRKKDSVQDYRYFRDPDLPALITKSEVIEKLRNALRSLPSAIEQRLQQQTELESSDVAFLARDTEVREYFLEVQRLTKLADQKIANWIIREYRGLLNQAAENVLTAINPNEFAALLNFMDSGTISGKIGKQVLALMLNEGLSAEDSVEKLGIKQISDEEILNQLIKDVCHDFSTEVQSYKSGKTKFFQFLMGQLMKKSNGSANPVLTQKLLKNFLEDENEQ